MSSTSSVAREAELQPSPAQVHAYRTSTGLAALAFSLAAVAGFVYGARIDAVVVGFPLLATAMLWGVSWLGARQPVGYDAERLRRRTWLARIFVVLGLVLAIVLTVAAFVVD